MKTPEFNPEDHLSAPDQSIEEQENIDEQRFLVNRQAQNYPEQLHKVEDFKSEIQQSKTDKVSVEDKATKSNSEVIIIDDREYILQYVPKNEIYPAFGYSDGTSALVREDLPPRVKKFVKAHELYHCKDEAKWGGWIGREIRANLIPGIKDPVGLLATIWATISDGDRIKLYSRRIKEGR